MSMANQIKVTTCNINLRLLKCIRLNRLFSSNNSSPSSIIPLKVYDNADTQKLEILGENKGKSGIYMWKNKNGKIYIGSAKDLKNRLKTINTIIIDEFSMVSAKLFQTSLHHFTAM